MPVFHTRRGAARPSGLEAELAQRMPGAQRARLFASGTDAVQAALRLARATTGRMQILKFEGHDHGPHDNVAVSIAPPLDSAGPTEHPSAVPVSAGQNPWAYHDTYVAAWNDVASLESYMARYSDETAAVLCEPLPSTVDVYEPDPVFMAAVRNACGKHGPLLIYDQRRTGPVPGLRLPDPDLVVWLQALGGSADLMGRFDDGRVVFDSGDPDPDTLVRALRDPWTPPADLPERLADLGLTVAGVPAVFQTTFESPPPANWRQAAVRDWSRVAGFAGKLAGLGVSPRGVWRVPYGFEDVDAAVQAAREAMKAAPV